MPEKVIGGGYLVPGAAEVEVPSWTEFKKSIDRLWQEFRYVNANKQELWDAVNALKREPAADMQSELRALRDAAFSAITQLDGPLPNDGWHVWKCIEVAGKRLDAIEKRLEAIQSDAGKAFRSVIDETLRPVFQYGLDLAIREMTAVKEENKMLKEEIASLRADINKLKAPSKP